MAVVTGASSGIGEATTLRLARAGMRVVAVARRSDRLDALAARHASIIPHVTDVTDTTQVDALAARVDAEFGACHALVNNAGVPGGRFDGRADLDDALYTFDVNVHGMVRCMAAFADLLERSAPSRCVNVASVAGKLGVGPAAYSASKFAMVGFSEAAALSWASRGITVCQLNPGFIVTEGFPQRHLQGTAFERLAGRPDDVARAIHQVLLSGATERTVPRWYRPAVVIRHAVPGLYHAAVRRSRRASGGRD
ncbi:MAG: SDR family oxidoreductase [Nitriliruptoraceae bacterium]